jgi:hypothetical protein
MKRAGSGGGYPRARGPAIRRLPAGGSGGLLVQAAVERQKARGWARCWAWRLAALALGPAAAPAEEARRAWGGADHPSSVALARCPDADCWTVTLANTVVTGRDLRSIDLESGGFAVTVLYEGRAGEAPDGFSVLPPPGFAAEPPALTVPDGAEGVIVLRPVPIG